MSIHIFIFYQHFILNVQIINKFKYQTFVIFAQLLRNYAQFSSRNLNQESKFSWTQTLYKIFYLLLLFYLFY